MLCTSRQQILTFSFTRYDVCTYKITVLSWLRLWIIYTVLAESSGVRAICLRAPLCHCRPMWAPPLPLHRCLPAPSSWQAQRAPWTSKVGQRHLQQDSKLAPICVHMRVRSTYTLTRIGLHARAYWKGVAIMQAKYYTWVTLFYTQKHSVFVYWKVTKIALLPSWVFWTILHPHR